MLADVLPPRCFAQLDGVGASGTVRVHRTSSSGGSGAPPGSSGGVAQGTIKAAAAAAAGGGTAAAGGIGLAGLVAREGTAAESSAVLSRLLGPCLRAAFNSADKGTQGLLGGLLANLTQLEKMVRNAVGAQGTARFLRIPELCWLQCVPSALCMRACVGSPADTCVLLVPCTFPIY